MTGRLANANYLRKLTRSDDPRRFPEASGGTNSFLPQLADEFGRRIFQPSPLKVFDGGRRILHSASSYADVLFLRHGCRMLRRKRGIRSLNRKQIASQIVKILEADVSHLILRTDITNFFGSIPVYEAMNLESVQACFPAVEYAWCMKMLSANPYTDDKLPRGLSISGELAEHFMAAFDRSVISHEGVVFYGRFVDDIVIVTASDDLDELEAAISDYLPKCLSFNPDKTQACRWGDTRQAKAGFDYLGFSFRRTSNIASRKRSEVHVGIATSKMLRYKKRVQLAFNDFIDNKDFRLLRDRIRYLTGGCSVYSSFQRRRITLGLSASHQDITDDAALQALDAYLGNWIRTASRDGVNSCFTKGQQTQLRRLSFTASYSKNIRHRFTGKRLWEIRGIFKHV
ncbi:antiviral reverse transcriptase Drt3a [Neorhodopirellula pilleata]|uniref:Reverse transcriptase (RNA-dependent DNA polymerase) n=1 Tax=Neorhodopirellula pilleata TaxID=2714738 RepID=A0A5C5ZWX7_9BACT|nr:antiviral reverse transcriptase Drt3a [Neorhodopirellula pilleata]TWT91635.1 Reverse transcriptase (RNA-dependent DNA polymerase) [Neorhodopirellula pilleata]